MTMLDRRGPGRVARSLAHMLLLALLLTACGRATPQVTADDGRDTSRPSGGIWVPETREVDDETPVREEEPAEVLPAQVDDGGDAEVDDAVAGTAAPRRDRRGAATPPAAPRSPRPDPVDESGAAPTGMHDEGPASSGSGDEPAGHPPADDGGSRERDAGQDAEDAVEAPELVGACGVERDGPAPTRDHVEEAVERLRDLLAEHFPETQAGAWVVDGQRLSVQVGFTEEARASLRSVCDRFEHPELLEGVRTTLSDADLQELASQARADRDALRDGRAPEDLPDEIRATAGRYAVTVAHEINGLRITVDRPQPSLRDAFRAHYTERIELVAGLDDEDGEVVAPE